MFTMLEDHDKKLKRLVAITLRPDFQRDYPYDPNNKIAETPEDAATRAAQRAAQIRAQDAKRKEHKQ